MRTLLILLLLCSTAHAECWVLQNGKNHCEPEYVRWTIQECLDEGHDFYYCEEKYKQAWLEASERLGKALVISYWGK